MRWFWMLLGGLMVWPGWAQYRTTPAEPTAWVRVPADSQAAYLYHTLPLLRNEGLLIYRQGAGQAWELLTETPLRPVASGRELQARLGPELFAIVQRAVRREEPFAVLLALYSDPVAGGTLSLLYPQVADLLARRFVDRTAPIGQAVRYRLVVVDAWGEATDRTLEVQAHLTPERPDPPAAFVGAQQSDRVELRWTYPARPTDGVVAFHVYGQVAGEAPVRLNDLPLLRSLNTTDYRFSTPVPTPGITIAYQVVAIDMTGQPSLPAGPVTIRIEDRQRPDRLTGVEAEALTLEGPVAVSWTPSIEPDVRGYFVYRATTATEQFVRLHENPIPVGTSRYVDTPPAGARPWFYRVTAVDSAGNESVPSAPAMVFLRDRTPPAAPTDLEARYDDGQVLLRWQHPAPAADLWSFVVLRRRLGKGAARAYDQVNLEAVRATRLEDTGPAQQGFEEGAFYEYAVLAADSARNFSDTVFVVLQIPDRTPPEPPRHVEAIGMDGVRIQLRWEATPSTDATAYRVYRRSVQGDSLLMAGPITRRFYRDEGVAVGQRYTYRVTAVDSAGNEGNPAEVQVWLRDTDPPATVRNLRAQRAPEGGVVLHWEPVRSPDLAGYRVYRARYPAGRYAPVTETLLTETRWHDPDGQPGYWYRVRAVDTSGNESRGERPVAVQ